MKSLKILGNKLIVSICIALTFLSFLATIPVNAAGKVSTDDFYYSGTTKGSYTIEKSSISKFIESLDTIADYLIGGMGMLSRAVIVGWTALMERCLTWILEAATGEDINLDKVDSTIITGSDDYVTLDAIFFNRVPLLNINFFNLEMDNTHTATGRNKDIEKMIAKGIFFGGLTNLMLSGNSKDVNEENNKSLVMVLKNTIAGWYYTFRAISFMIMLIMLIYIGIKLAIHSSTKEKALYKKVLFDWLVGMILVFTIHFIMIFMISFNEVLVDVLSHFRTGIDKLAVYEYGLIERASQPIQTDEIEIALYNEVKTRAYDAKLTVGMTGMIMYMVLVYYAWKYTFIYLKRYLTVAVLTIMAPLVAVSYAFNRVRSGKSIVFSKWFKEYLFSVLLQSIHALLYIVFLDVALRMSLNSIASIILSFAMMNMIAKSEDLFRKIFGIKGTLTTDIAQGEGLKEVFNDIKGIGKAMAGGKLAKAYMKTSTRILTKPLRYAGEKVFNEAIIKGVMVRKAEEKYDREKNGSEFETEKAKEQEWLTRVKYAALGKRISIGEINVKELEDLVANYKVGQILVDKDGNFITKVDESFIKKEKKALEEIQTADRLMKGIDKDGNRIAPVDLAKQYDSMSTKVALTKKYISDKWKEIIDPYQYTKKVKEWEEKGEDGSVIKKAKYEAIEKKRESGSSYKSTIGKALFGGKTTDSASKRVLDQLKPDNLLNLNSDQKKALTTQVEFAKKGVTGFFGIMAGLPLLVTEPKIGAVFLYKGISNMGNVVNFRGRRQRRALKRLQNLNLDPKTRYILTGFAGGSAQTIAEGAKYDARMQVQELEEARQEKDTKIVKNVKRRIPKLAEKLQNNSGYMINTYSGNGTEVYVDTEGENDRQELVKVSTINTPSPLGVTLGSPKEIFLGNIGSNLWADFNAVAMASRKANWKAFEKKMKYGYTESYLDKLADKYFEFENEQANEYISRHEQKAEEKAKTLGALYTAYLSSERQRIDEMSDEELVLQNNFEKPIVYYKETVDGVEKNSITGASRRELIDEAIIQSAKSIGVINLKEFELTSSNIDDITKRMTDHLRVRGILKKNEDISVLIQDVEKQIKDRTASLVKIEESRPQEAPTFVEEKMADEAIIEVMKQGDQSGTPITVPSKVDSTKVQEVLKRKYDSIIGSKPTEETASVLSAMQHENPEQSMQEVSSDTKISPLDIAVGRLADTVETRKETLEKEVEKPLSTKVSKDMKRQLKKKLEFSLDQTLIENQEQLDHGVVTPNVKLDGLGIDITSNSDLQLHSNAQEPIKVETIYEDGAYKKKLTNSSENMLIDQAIIKTANSIGISDLTKFDSTLDNIDKITRTMTDYLRKRKVIDENQEVTNLIQKDKLRKKIESRKEELSNNSNRNMFITDNDDSDLVSQATESARRTNSVLKMLELQTQLHQEKIKMKDKYMKRQFYIAELFSESQSSRRLDGYGSRMVQRPSTKQSNSNSSEKKNDKLSSKKIDQLLKTYKNSMK